MTKVSVIVRLTMVGIAAFGVSPANAGEIQYGDFGGDTVLYLDVTEDGDSLFGAPNIIGDMLVFNPGGFDANVSGGQSQMVKGGLSFMLESHEGFSIEELSVGANGEYSLMGFGEGATQVGYGFSMELFVWEVDGIAMKPISLPMGLIEGGDNLAMGTDDATPWFLSLQYDVDAALDAANVPFEFGATRLEVMITNEVAASSELDSMAEIITDSFSIDAETAVIPAPGAALLLLLGACAGSGVGAGRRS